MTSEFDMPPDLKKVTPRTVPAVQAIDREWEKLPALGDAATVTVRRDRISSGLRAWAILLLGESKTACKLGAPREVSEATRVEAVS